MFHLYVIAGRKNFWKCIALLNGRPKGIDYHQMEEVCAVWSTCVFWKLEDTSQEIQDSNVSKIWVVVGLGGSPGEGKNFQPVGIWKHAPVNSIAAFWPGIPIKVTYFAFLPIVSPTVPNSTCQIMFLFSLFLRYWWNLVALPHNLE